MVDWPTTLPCSLQIDGQAGGIADGRIRSATDTGPGKMRRRSTAMAEPISGTMIMTAAEIATLRTFISGNLNGGVSVFNFPDPITHSTIEVRFATSLPVWSPMPGKRHWMVQLDLEKIP